MTIIIYGHIGIEVGRWGDQDWGNLICVRYKVFQYLVAICARVACAIRLFPIRWIIVLIVSSAAIFVLATSGSG